MSDRLAHEIEHGKKISHDAESVWNWSSPGGKRRATRRAELMIKAAKITKNDLVLELGCGTGLFTEKVFNQTGAKIIATDISEELLAQGRKKLPGTTFQIEDAMNLSFKDESFDVVFGSSILHHLDMELSYKEIYRVLKPGGRMVFAEPNMLNPQIFIQKNIPFIKRMLGDSPDETAVIRWKAVKQLERVGFKNVDIYPYDFLHPATPGIMVPFVERMGKLVEKIPLLKEIAGSVIISAEK